jgi:hypothetical protein
MSERQTPAHACRLLSRLYRAAMRLVLHPLQDLIGLAGRWLTACFWPLMVVYFLLIPNN